MKTAPDSAVSMLSGVVQDQQAAGLAAAFSTGELVRIMELLERTMQGFTRSASRRVDAELCIISLCQPELQLDAKSLNARLTKLEEQIKGGKLISAPVQRTEKLPYEEPPAHTDLDVPPEDPVVPEFSVVETPVGFWTELVSAIRQELGPPISGFFTTTPNAPVQGVLREGKVILRCTNSFTLEMINKPEVLALVGRKATAILNKPISAAAEDISATGRSNPRLEQLMDFGRSHSNIVNIKDS
jgi:DNA polymerase-3 subunit gamma/tau